MTPLLLALYLAPLAPVAQEPAHSLIVVLMDDVGPEHLEFTPQGADAANPVSTPTLSALADAGIRYTGMWTCPNCSPTRAALLTGRYGHRTGVGTIIKPGETYELALTEATIADRLSARGYSTALFGKWHLGEVNPDQACAMGFQAWTGSQANLMWGANYWYWARWDDTNASTAVWTLETAYAPTVTTDAALAWIDAQETAGSPYFALVAYHLAHAPFHDPPGMGPYTTSLEKYRAMIEYLDSEIGRLLAGVDLDATTVLVLSDNGAPGSVVLAPNTPEHSKGTAYRGGIETTMIVAGYAADRAIYPGKNYAGQEIHGYPHVVDLYATALRLLPAINPDPGGWPATDSKPLYSLTGKWIEPAREFAFTEKAEPLGAPPGGPYEDLSRAIEESGYKAVWDETGAVELYDVAADPWETVDVLLDGISAEEQLVLDGFQARLAELGIP